LFAILLGGEWACGALAHDVGSDAGVQDAARDSMGDAGSDSDEAGLVDVRANVAADVVVEDVVADSAVCPEAPGSGSSPPSCASGSAGMNNCGLGVCTESCCTSLEVEGGTFYRTFTNSGNGPTGVADPATVSSFRLDKYAVTVGRFRQFVNAVMPTDAGPSGYAPPTGSGKHTNQNGGQGLASAGDSGIYEPGWLASDDANLLPTSANLDCYPPAATWTASPDGNENKPINCVNWYEAYAFCIWDEGFLPSDAEREYAMVGGSQQREYPWGTAAPGTENKYAIYGCYYPSGSGVCTQYTGVLANIAPVGAAALGAGLWGQLDLSGEVEEWTLDWYASNGEFLDPCVDCANLTIPAPEDRVLWGGEFNQGASFLVYRSAYPPPNRDPGIGIRCARIP
jgi:formylglycine-generating enzyme required for sulfatase activity